jgi:hypothetical protein
MNFVSYFLSTVLKEIRSTLAWLWRVRECKRGNRASFEPRVLPIGLGEADRAFLRACGISAAE